MKTTSIRSIFKALPAPVVGSLLALFGILPCIADAPFGVPVRVHFNFILNGSGTRPATGNINTDSEVDDQVKRANQILATWGSELRIDILGINEVEGASDYYATDASDEGRDALRAAAMDDPNRFYWRDDAVNIYITSASASAISKFPPDNDIIVIGQNVFETVVMHELGHSLSLYHTHQGQNSDCTNNPCVTTCVPGTDDGCSDTLPDATCYDQDEIALNAYAQAYANLTTAQKYSVDMVWFNVMSYHNGDDRWMLSSCQIDKLSSQAYADRSRLLTKAPVYVDASYDGLQNGSFTRPYQSIQNATDAGVLDNKVLVLEAGAHAKPAGTLKSSTDIVTRKGTSTIRGDKPDYDLPYTLEESKNPKVREAILKVQQSDRKQDIAGVITHLLEAEEHASGRERDSIRLELAERYRDSEQFEEAVVWFEKTAADADQPELRKRMLKKAGKMKVLAGERKEKETKQK